MPQHAGRKLLLLRSEGHDPFHNLALEDKLLADMAQTPTLADAILYLWQNEHTVVIGRNQNAWVECHTALLEEEGGRLARRTTGGGAVYHDLGNLNFSILLPQRDFDVDKSFGLIVCTVRELGLNAERSGRNDILLEGMKFSGNAFRLARGVGLHHGTILLNSDYQRLGRYLTVAPEKLRARGIPSVRSRVTNLSSFLPELGLEQLTAAIEEAFIAQYGGASPTVERIPTEQFTAQADFPARHERFASWDWRYGEALRFEHEIGARYEWGLVRLGFAVENGRIRQLRFDSDALDADWVEQVADCLIDTPFHSSAIAACIRAASTEVGESFAIPHSRMAEDLSALIMEQGW